MTKSSEHPEPDMKPDAFEQQLQRQPLRQVPAEWRNVILAAARTAQDHSPAAAIGERSSSGAAGWPAIRDWLSSLLWPSPVAWGGLAGIWFLLLTANHSPSSETRAVARNQTRPDAELITTWAEKERLLSELVQPSEIVERKTSSPQPRSQRREDSPIA
jgi:hypothetical protein